METPSGKAIVQSVPIKKRRWHATPYLFVAPALFILFVFVFIPILSALYLSFTRYDIIHLPQWVGLKNYQGLLSDELFWQSVRNTFQYMIGTIPVGMALSLLLAVILNARLRAVTVYRSLFYLPVVTSLVAVAMIWMWLYAPTDYGLFNAVLKLFGFDTSKWLGDPNLAMWCLVAMSVWKGLGYNMVIYLAGLQGIPIQLYEAAQIDGASKWQQFRTITLPLLMPTTFFILTISIIGASQVFAQVYVMTNGGPMNATTTVVHQIFQNAFKYLKMGYASAMAFTLFLILFLISYLNWRVFRRMEEVGLG